MGSKKSQTVGFRYYMDLHFGICYGAIDRMIRLVAGQRQGWAGNQEANGAIDVNAPNLFGGDEREGGLQGYAELMMGGPAQTLPGNVAAALPSPAPAYRGIFSLFYSGQISANNPYIKPFAFQVTRVLKGWVDDAPWYPAKAEIEVFAGERVVLLPPNSYNWRYQEVAAADLTNYSATNFDDSAWPVGVMPFGTNDWRPDAGAEGFPEWPNTAWSYPPPIKDIWCRREINFGSQRGQVLEVLIDNYVRVYVNGVDLGQVGQATGYGLYQFPVDDYLNPDGSALIALRCNNFGGPGYIGARVVQNVGAGQAMNPAHIIYQCHTDPQWGMGYPAASIDAANYAEVADTLHAEGFGLCMIWNQQDEVGNFVKQVIDHIGAISYSDPKTGLFKLKLLRADYDPADLELFSDTNGKVVSLDSFQRVGYGDTINEVTVVYKDVNTNKDVPLTAQNLANIQAQGAVVSRTVQYPGIPTASLAARVAQRDLLALSTPLARGRMTVNRNGWSMVPGDVFKLTWPKLGVAAVAMRVINVSGGNLADGKISVDFAEDVFGLPSSSYVEQQPPGWVEPDTSPELITQQTVAEIPYWTLVRELSAADVGALDQDASYFAPIAARPTALSIGFDTHSRTGSAAYALTSVGSFVPGGRLAAAISEQATVVALTDAVDLASAVVGDVAIIGQGREGAEFVLVEAVDTGTSSVTISRGVLDTTPRAHGIASPIYFTDAGDSEDRTERATGEVVDFRLATIATGGSLDPNLATPMTTEAAAQRQFRPYPPGNMKINGETWPTAIDVPFTVTWAHRDRLSQTAYVVEQDEASIGPEPGTTYNAYAYNHGTDALLASDTGIVGTSWVPAGIDGGIFVRIEVAAVRDGVESWQRQVRVFEFAAEVLVTESQPEAITLEDGIEQIGMDGLSTSDPTASFNRLLLHFDGPEGSNSIVDSSGTMATTSAYSTISTQRFRHGGSSLRVGSNGGVLYPHSAAIHLNGDFTIDAWIYLDALTGADQWLFVQGGAVSVANASWGIALMAADLCWHFMGSSTNASYDIGGTTGAAGNLGKGLPGQWQRLTVTRKGNVWRGFLNGKKGYEQTLALTPYNSSPRGLLIGGLFNGAWPNTPFANLIGNYEEIRIKNGIALYTADFDVDHNPFPNS
jgi:hypothetical protein